MKNSKILSLFIVTLTIAVITSLSSVTVFANSSWVWISEKRPFDILPFVIAGTLLIETLAINFIPEIHKPLKVFLIITAANSVSFILPYLILLAHPEPYPAWDLEVLNSGFNPIVSFLFLFFTLCAELPVVYFSLKKNTDNNKKLLLTIIGVNILTTILVGVVEHTICEGHY